MIPSLDQTCSNWLREASVCTNDWRPSTWWLIWNVVTPGPKQSQTSVVSDSTSCASSTVCCFELKEIQNESVFYRSLWGDFIGLTEVTIVWGDFIGLTEMTFFLQWPPIATFYLSENDSSWWPLHAMFIIHCVTVAGDAVTVIVLNIHILSHDSHYNDYVISDNQNIYMMEAEALWLWLLQVR